MYNYDTDNCSITCTSAHNGFSKDPHWCIIATMGLKIYKKDLLINHTNEAHWSVNTGTYSAKVSEYLLAEKGLKGVVNDAYNNLHKVNDDNYHLQLKVSTLHGSCYKYEEQAKQYERCT